MKYVVACCLVVVFCTSCSLFSNLRKRQFHYTVNDKSHTLRILVPKKYAQKQQVVDSAGNQQLTYTYKNGALLYIVYTTDTLAQFQSIDTSVNIPKPHAGGGLMSKGLDSDNLFWREIRSDSFRIGYRHVQPEMELLFDSAVNYTGKLRFKH